MQRDADVVVVGAGVVGLAVAAALARAGRSLLILEREVYEDAGFRRTLCDAVESLPVGSAWDLTTVVGPLIRPPRGAASIHPSTAAPAARRPRW